MLGFRLSQIMGHLNTENHLSKDCPHVTISDDNPDKRIPQEKVKCALCNGNHTANYRQCEKRVQYKQKLTNQNTQQNTTSNNRQPNHRHVQVNTRQTTPRYPVSSHTTYANVVRSQPQTSTYSLLSPDQCLEIFDLFTTELLKCRTIEEQIRTIARLSFHKFHVSIRVHFTTL